MDKGIEIVSVLLVLSFISERMANLVKLYFPSRLLRKFSRGKISTLASGVDVVDNKVKEKYILVITVICGIITAIVCGSNIFFLVENVNSNSSKVFASSSKYDGEFVELIQICGGYVLTGFFLSFGSKFWHDILDILFYVKSTRRWLAKSAMKESRIIEPNYTNLNQKGLSPISTHSKNKSQADDLLEAAVDAYRSRFSKGALDKATFQPFFNENGVIEIDVIIYDEGELLAKSTDNREMFEFENNQSSVAAFANIAYRKMPTIVSSEQNYIPTSVSEYLGKRGVFGAVLSSRVEEKKYAITCRHCVYQDPFGIKEDVNPIKRVVNDSLIDFGNRAIILPAIADVALIEINSTEKFLFRQMGDKELFSQMCETVQGIPVGSKVYYCRGKDLKKGTILSKNTRVLVSIDQFSKQIWFENVIELRSEEDVCVKGDSGSFIFDYTSGIAYGMIFASNENDRFFAIPLPNILSSFNLSPIQKY